MVEKLLVVLAGFNSITRIVDIPRVYSCCLFGLDITSIVGFKSLLNLWGIKSGQMVICQMGLGVLLLVLLLKVSCNVGDAPNTSCLFVMRQTKIYAGNWESKNICQ